MVRTKIAIAWLFSFCVLQAFGQEDIHLRINQIGYSPNDTKIAAAFSKKAFRERVLLVDATTEIVKMEIIPQRIETDDWGVFPYYFTIDFSQVEAPGAYFLKTKRSGITSPTFQIGDNVYYQKQETLLEFMRQQRCGYNPTLDMVCHEKDGRSYYGPVPDSTYFDLSGGWHDVGDYSTNDPTMDGTAGAIIMMTHFGNQINK